MIVLILFMMLGIAHATIHTQAMSDSFDALYKDTVDVAAGDIFDLKIHHMLFNMKYAFTSNKSISVYFMSNYSFNNMKQGNNYTYFKKFSILNTKSGKTDIQLVFSIFMPNHLVFAPVDKGAKIQYAVSIAGDNEKELAAIGATILAPILLILLIRKLVC